MENLGEEEGSKRSARGERAKPQRVSTGDGPLNSSVGLERYPTRRLLRHDVDAARVQIERTLVVACAKEIGE